MRSRGSNVLRGSSKGFTIVELVVALVIFLIGVLGVTGLLITIFHANRSADNRTRADQLLTEKVEEFHSVAYSAITPGSDQKTVGDVVFRRSWTVTADDPVDDVSTIVITAQWQERDATFRVETATLRSAQ